MLLMLAAFFLANLAGFQRKLGHGGYQFGLLRCQRLKRTAHGNSLVHGLGALGHGLVSIAQQYQAMGYAGLSLDDAIRSSGKQALRNGSVHMAVVMHHLLR
jgi:hypothetical protein